MTHDHLLHRFVRSAVLGLVVVAATTVACRAADEPGPKPSTLDDALLQGLGGGEPVKPSQPSLPAIKPRQKNLDDALLEGLGGRPSPGSDAPPAGADSENPLLRLNRQMREVEKSIGAAKADAQTQAAQQRIVDELNELIKQAKDRRQSSSSKSSSQKSEQQTDDQRQRVEQPRQATMPAPANQPAAESTQRQGAPPEPVQPDAEQMADVLKQIWGQLPARLREQMLQSSTEKFVPKYETAIEDYFRALAAPQENR